MTDFHRSLDHALSGEPRWPAPAPAAEVDPHTDWGVWINVYDDLWITALKDDVAAGRYWLQRWICDVDGVALAEQEIPAEGTE